ncbi:helix-turn-helix domain-containing protein [Actinokineospora sp. 24-640]
MVVVCPSGGRATREQVRLKAAEWFGGTCPWRRSPVGCGCRPTRSTRGGVDGAPRARPGWRRRGRAGRRADSTSGGWTGSPKPWIAVRPRAGFGDDQRWTLARVSDLIARLFHTRYTPRGVSYLLHRMGFSPQVPAHRAVERDEDAVVTWRRETWPAGNGSGGARRLAVLRGRGRADTAPAESPHLGAARADPRPWRCRARARAESRSPDSSVSAPGNGPG